MDFGQCVVSVRWSVHVEIFLHTRVKCVLGLAALMDLLELVGPLDASHVRGELIRTESLHLSDSCKNTDLVPSLLLSLSGVDIISQPTDWKNFMEHDVTAFPSFRHLTGLLVSNLQRTNSLFSGSQYFPR